jgi:hypothetical protein
METVEARGGWSVRDGAGRYDDGQISGGRYETLSRVHTARKKNPGRGPTSWPGPTAQVHC